MNKILSINLLLVIALSCAFVNFSTAAVVQGTIGTGTYTAYDGTATPNTYGLDFNNDGNIEFSITDFQLAMNYTNTYLNFNPTTQNNIVTQGTLETGGWDVVSALNINTSVGSSSNFGAEGDAFLMDMENSAPVGTPGTPFYVGFRVVVNNTIHYGYAKVLMTGSYSAGITTTWQAIYYETNANTPILTGATPSSIAENTMPTISIFPNPTQQTLNINLQDINKVSSISITDMAGKQIFQAAAKPSLMTISVENWRSGIYFVRLETTDGQTAVTKFIKK